MDRKQNGTTRSSETSKLKILFCTDVHGSDTVFRKFLNASKMYKVNAAMIGGDLTGKALAFVSRTNGSYESDTLGRKWYAKNQEELESLVREFRKKGFYVHIDSPEPIEEIKSSPEKSEELLKEYILKSISEWIQLAEERLKDTGIKCYISPGNDDFYEIDEVLNSSRFVVNPELKITLLADDYEMITLGQVNITPWNCPRDVPEENLYETISQLSSKLSNPKRTIFNFHAPPYNTYLDVAMELDANLRPVMKGLQPSMTHVGSLSVRKAIEEYQPLVGLHGHIHESKAVEKIGRTLCINPGSAYQDGTLNAVIVDLDDEVKNYMFISG